MERTNEELTEVLGFDPSELWPEEKSSNDQQAAPSTDASKATKPKAKRKKSG